MCRSAKTKKKDDIVQICRVNSILDENVNSKSFTKKRLLDYLVECGVFEGIVCLQYAYHFLTDGNSYAQLRMRA